MATPPDAAELFSKVPPVIVTAPPRRVVSTPPKTAARLSAKTPPAMVTVDQSML